MLNYARDELLIRILKLSIRLDLKIVRENSYFCTTSLLGVYYLAVHGGRRNKCEALCWELRAPSGLCLFLSAQRSIYSRSLEPGLVWATNPIPATTPASDAAFKIRTRHNLQFSSNQSLMQRAYSNTASGIVPKMSFFQSSFNHLNFEPEQSSSWNFGQNVGDFTDLENNIDIGNFGIDISLSIHSFSYRRSPENGHGHRHRRVCWYQVWMRLYVKLKGL